ncbi:MAG: PAP2 family protein [Actinobacteria bacterium ATB1]|nr:PAP2 family protein [Actinobacteria bacterium ATB1]
MNSGGIDNREDIFLGHPVRDHRLLSAVGLALVVLAALVIVPATRDLVRNLDETWNGWMWKIEGAVLVQCAEVLDLLGRSLVLVPVRVGVAIFLLVKRRWAALTGWVFVILASETAIQVLKPLVGRSRPGGQLVETSSASFPSGHALGAAVTALGLVLVLTRPGPRRRVWKTAAILYVALMAWSRTYLHVHWLSDVVAGALLGTFITAGTFVLLDARARQVSSARPSAASAPSSAPSSDSSSPDSSSATGSPTSN